MAFFIGDISSLTWELAKESISFCGVYGPFEPRTLFMWSIAVPSKHACSPRALDKILLSRWKKFVTSWFFQELSSRQPWFIYQKSPRIPLVEMIKSHVTFYFWCHFHQGKYLLAWWPGLSPSGSPHCLFHTPHMMWLAVRQALQFGAHVIVWNSLSVNPEGLRLTTLSYHNRYLVVSKQQ